jgi:release factor glutamine methyltransferase
VATLVLREALQQGTERLRHLGQGRRDAELLLLRVLHRDRAWLLTHREAELSPDEWARYAEWLARRARHEPVQYIVGEQEFWGLALKVTPDVLIPRPETEHLVEAALARVEAMRSRVEAGNAPLRIADVGTGSGAIAIALAHALPQAEVTALDLSTAALRVAEENAARHGLAERIRFLHSDLLQAVASERFEVIVSNPPYVPAGELLEAQVQQYEPHGALFAGPSGLDIYERLIPQAEALLTPGGGLLLEIGHGQKTALEDFLRAFDDVSFIHDLQGIPRVAIGRARAPRSEAIQSAAASPMVNNE